MCCVDRLNPQSKADKEMAGNNRPRSPLSPTPRALKRPFPLFHPSLRLLALHFRLEALRDFPLLRDFLAALPHPGSEAREICRAERRGLEHFRAHHGNAEQVRLEL